MKKILDLITDEVTKAFTECGYDAKYAKVTLSNRPDLCEYQCNGAMAAAKEYKKAPFMIADEVVEKLAANPIFARQRLLYQTDLIFVNTSVTAPWQPPRNTKKPHL